MFEPQLQVRGVAEAVAVPHGRRCSQELGQLGTVTAGEEPWRGEEGGASPLVEDEVRERERERKKEEDGRWILLKKRRGA